MKSCRYRLSHLEQLEQRRLLVAGTGLTAQYFSDTELTTLSTTRVESSLEQDWGLDAPAAQLNPDGFSARFSGQIEAQATGTHILSFHAEVGARLWINGRQLLDRWADTGTVSATLTSHLIAGRRYDIVLEIRETVGPASFQLRWTMPNAHPASISPGYLFPSERGFLESRRWDIDSQSTIAQSTIEQLTGLPTFPSQPNLVTWLDKFESTTADQAAHGQQLLGHLFPPTTGNYRFFLSSSASAELWLSNTDSPENKQLIAWVDQATGFREWTQSSQQQSSAVSLIAGQAYTIEVLHSQATLDSSASGGHVSVGWLKPGQAEIDVIDGQHLAPPLPTVRIYSQRPDVVEGDSDPLHFVIQRTGATLTHPLTVSYTVGGTATPMLDYVPLSGSVTIPAGQATTSIFVSPISDELLENTETVTIDLIDGPGYQVGWKSERSSIGRIQNSGAAIPGGTLVSPAMLLSNYQAFGGNFAQALPEAPYDQILQATIEALPTNRWDAQLRVAITTPIVQGDVLWAELYARSLSGQANITAVAERNSAPFTKSLDKGVTLGEQWTRIQLPFVALESYDVGQLTFGFFLGAQLQSVQLADLTIRNHGPSRNITPSLYWLNNIGGTWGYSAGAAVSGQSFPRATEITTVATPVNNDAWRLQFGGRNSSAVRAGDTLRLEFYARSSSGANPRIDVAIQTTDVFDTLTYQPIELSSSWQYYSVQTTLNADYDVLGLQAMFNVGFAPQSVQVAAIGWTNLSAATDSQDLPTLVPPTNYQGRDADAPWRDVADQRIADHRQSTLTVQVVDTSGNPVDGALVSVQQTRHHFQFGSAIDGANNLLSPTGGPDALKYQSEIKRLFNSVTIENSMKWPNFLAEADRASNVVDWAVQNGLHVRGHNILWPSRQNMPSQVWAEYDALMASQGSTAAANYLRQATTDRVAAAITSFADQVFEWDIVNEPYDNRDVKDILGQQVLIDWFLQARQLAPDLSRVLNDYDIFSRNGQNSAHRANFDNWLAMLVADNAIERIGEQSHYSESTLTDIAVLGQLIESYFAQFNLPIAITEFDIDTTNTQLQADYLRDYLTMAFSQAAVDQFTQWGFWSQSHWKPNAALYNADFSPRPHGQVYEDLVFGKWWTDLRGTTRDGQFRAAVFKGDYQVTVTHGNYTVSQAITNLVHNGAVTIVVNQIPIIANQSFQINENSAGSPGTVQASDSDADQSLTYIILAGNESNLFAISPTNGALSIVDPSRLDYETQSVHQLIVRVSDNGSPSQSSVAEVTIELLDLPELIAPPVIGNGTPQRSLVEQLSMSFDGPISIDQGAFQVNRLGSPVAVTTAAVQSVNEQGQPVVTLTFSGAHTRGNRALLDGYYRLAIDGTKIRRGTSALDINGDGIGGDALVIGDLQSDQFFALYGDANGDGLVDADDFANLRPAQGRRLGEPGYDALADFDLNGIVDNSDFTEFRYRYGRSKLEFPSLANSQRVRRAQMG